VNIVHFGDCRDSLRKMTADGVKVQMCVTSPPYYGLRDYGHDGQIGMEETPEQFIAALVEVFQCVRDVLADDGVLWVNMGDSYASAPKNRSPEQSTLNTGLSGGLGTQTSILKQINKITGELKAKDLIGIPWMLAFALRADGWYLRKDIIWNKPNPMPESVTDRPTSSHEYIFLLSKQPTYFYDHEAIKEKGVSTDLRPSALDRGREFGYDSKESKMPRPQASKPDKQRGHSRRHAGFNDRWDAMEKAEQCSGMRNKRSVWTVATKPYTGAHFATYPPELIEPCILAGSRPGDIVLDPFFGSGTTGQVAMQLGRQYIGCELNPAYEALQLERTRQPSLEFA